MFDFNISTGYPHDAPKVKCLTRVRLRWLLGCTAAWRLHSVLPYTHASEDRLHCVHERRHDDFISRQVYHPNIDTEGNICLNILREDWKPVLSINSVVYGLNFLFLVRSHEANCVRSARQGRLLSSSGSLRLCQWQRHMCQLHAVLLGAERRSGR